jgi:hypothetical protein
MSTVIDINVWYSRFEKKPLVVIAFCGYLAAVVFAWKWTKSESIRHELVIPYQERLVMKDSIILSLTEKYARAQTINELKNELNKK